MAAMVESSVFAAFDRDGDGKVSASELRGCVAAALGEEVSEEEAAAVLAAADADGDWLLDPEEFSRLAGAVVAGHDEEDAVRSRCLRGAFGVYAVKDGGDEEEKDYTTMRITPASLWRTLSRLGSGGMGLEECRAMICRFDLDGDGVLSFDEFAVMMSMA